MADLGESAAWHHIILTQNRKEILTDLKFSVVMVIAIPVVAQQYLVAV